MNRELVESLESACEAALAEALQDFPLESCTPQVLHLMSKAAVTVLEAAEAAGPPPREKRR